MMGRRRKYRNAADKQAAYRQRKKLDQLPDDVRCKIDVLRKIAASIHLQATIEVYKRFDGTSYKLLKFVWHWMTIDRETFEAIEADLILISQTYDTKLYKFQSSFFAGAD